MSSSNGADSITGIRLNGETFREGRIYRSTIPLRKTPAGLVDTIFSSTPEPLTWSFEITEDRLTLFISKDFTVNSSIPGLFKAKKYIFQGKTNTGSNSEVAKSFSFRKVTTGFFQGESFFADPIPRPTSETIFRRRYNREVKFSTNRKAFRAFRRANSGKTDLVQLDSPIFPGITLPQINRRSNLGSLLPEFSGNWWNQSRHIQDPITS
jgi:hypothetical protein